MGLKSSRGTLVLATLLVAVFVLEAALGFAGSEHALVLLGALRTRDWSSADWWRILTFSLLHLTWWHLAIDTAGVLWLGTIVEGRFGSAAFAAIVLGGAAASGAAAMLLGRFLPTTGIVVGSSGVVCGLLAAALMLAFLWSSHGAEDDQGLRRPLLICLITVTGISFMPGVSLAGHLGGFAGGALTASMLKSPALQRTGSS